MIYNFRAVVLGLELGSFSSGKAQKNLANKKRAGPPCHTPREAPRTKAATWSTMRGPWRTVWRPSSMARDVVHSMANRHTRQILWHEVWWTATHFFKIIDCVAVRHAILQDWVYWTRFCFLAMPVEFFSLLITKKCYVLRFVSKDPSRGHLRWFCLSRLMAMQPWYGLI